MQKNEEDCVSFLCTLSHLWIIWLSRHFKMQHHDWFFISSRNFIFNWFYQYQKSWMFARFNVIPIFECDKTISNKILLLDSYVLNNLFFLNLVKSYTDIFMIFSIMLHVFCGVKKRIYLSIWLTQKIIIPFMVFFNA